MRKTGVWLIVLAYAVLLYSSLAAQAYGAPTRIWGWL
jgi:hypothetical protein